MAEERIRMGARGGLYFSTRCMSSQRHDRPAGQVSVQIRLSLCSGSRSQTKRLEVLKMVDLRVAAKGEKMCFVRRA